MNRSAVRELVAPDVSVAPGEVLVPTEVGDAVHGPLPSPAAQLVAGTLLRKGKHVSHGSVTRCAEPGGDDGGAVLFVATCQQRKAGAAML